MRRGTELDVDYSEQSGFLVGKSAALADWYAKKDQSEFNKLVNRIRVTNHTRKIYAEGGERLEQLRSLKREWYRSHKDARGTKAAQKKAADKRHAEALAAYRRSPLVCTCESCGTQWCPFLRGGLYPSVVPRYCGTRCYQRSRADLRKAAYAARKAKESKP